MSDLPGEAVEAAARVIDDYRVDAPLDYPGASKAATRKARNILKAAAPVIRADERRRVIAEIQASNLGAPLVLNSDETARFLSGPELREKICAFIAEGSGE